MTPLATGSGGGQGMPTLPQAQLFVGNASGQAVARVVSGHATIDQNGVVTVGNLPASVIVSGVFDAAQIPALPYAAASHSHDASNIITGVFDSARIPALPYAAASHSHDAAEIITGVFDNARVNWAAPGTQGSVTPNTGAFTTLAASGVLTLSNGAITTPNGLNIDSNGLIYDAANDRLSVGGAGAFLAVATKLQVNGGRFDVNNPSSSSAFIRVTGSSSNIEFGLNSGNPYIDGSTLFTFRVASQEAARISVGRDFGIGTTSPSFRLHVNNNNAATNAVFSLAGFDATSQGTPADGFGFRNSFRLESSSNDGVAQNAAEMDVLWPTATHATRKARVVWRVYDTAAREALRMEASGSAPMIGFLGASAIARINMGTWGSLTDAQKLDALRDVVSGFGLASYS